jgi:glycosyltransferase involved in cell wall biosynthesis
MSALSELFVLEKTGRHQEALERLRQHRCGAPGFSPISPFNLDLLEKRLRVRLAAFPKQTKCETPSEKALEKTGLTGFFALEKAGHYQEVIERIQRHRNGAPGFPPISPFNLDLLEKRLRATTIKVKTYFQYYREVINDGEPKELRQALARTEAMLEALRRQHKQQAPHPLVSVIMPTHNRAAIIGRSIATVLEQSYANLELLVCDDASDDDTAQVIGRLGDTRIRYLSLTKGGAAAARNAGLAVAHGTIIAYLDSDNYWHPDYLLAMVTTLRAAPGHSAIYCDFLDFQVRSGQGAVKLCSFERPDFSHEALLKKPFIDLNSFIHLRELYDCYGGFNPILKRRQDYDLMLKYTWLRDPLHLKCLLVLYQRNDSLIQITTTQKNEKTSVAIVKNAVDSYFKSGLPVCGARWPRKVTILSWDMSRNHFSKPFAVAEALSSTYEVQLISFRFFEELIFPPLEGVKPSFETVYLQGRPFPEFFDTMEQALLRITGEIIYVVKPRLPSLGLALLANQRLGMPIALEINDLETVVADPKKSDLHVEHDFSQVGLDKKELLNPYSDLWSHLMDPIAKQVPTLVTHNQGLNRHFLGSCLYMRNVKDEAVYDPAQHDRDSIRAELGYGPKDRIILFGGLIRKHKGIYELIELLKRLDDPRYKLLFIGSRVTPDQKKLQAQYGGVVRVLPPQGREEMARINLAADLVILWLDPDVPASHYQFPYKATDAFAMGTPVIANDISDLGDLARQEYLRNVPFGDWDAMVKTVRQIFDNPEQTERMRQAARRLYLRQFSYAAVRANFALIAYRATCSFSHVLPVAERFAQRYGEFARQLGSSAILAPQSAAARIDSAPLS